MKAPDVKPEVKLVGEDGNAFAVMGKAKNALRKAGADKEYVDIVFQITFKGCQNSSI